MALAGYPFFRFVLAFRFDAVVVCMVYASHWMAASLTRRSHTVFMLHRLLYGPQEPQPALECLLEGGLPEPVQQLLQQPVRSWPLVGWQLIPLTH